MNKKGISLVALVITIIVLIILTAAVVMTGISTPENAEDAVRAYNQSMVQDAVTLYVMTSMLNDIDDFAATEKDNTKTVATILQELYTPTNKTENADTGVVSWSLGSWNDDADTKLGISISDADLNALYELTPAGIVSTTGVVNEKAPANSGE